MSSEKEIKQLIEKLQTGELSSEGQNRLDELLNKHPEYKDLIQTHHLIAGLKTPLHDPEPAAFSKMRADVMREIRQKEEEVPGWPETFINKFKSYVTRPEMAIAALTLIIGFLFGRALPPDKDSFTSNIMGQISVFARDNKKLEDIRKSPYTYSNISFKEVDQEKVALSFDVTTHLDMTAKKDDPLVRDVIAQSLLNPSNIGSELKAISFTQGTIDRKIKEALIFSMKSTPILAVRLKAMNSLSQYNNDREIEEAFMDVLTDEESVRMRLLAIDYLTNNNLAPETLKKVLAQSEVPTSPAVLIKVKNYIEAN